MSRDDMFSRRNPHRLYRRRQGRWIAGVCAGIADYFGIDVAIVRLATVIGLFVMLPVTLLGYLIGAIVLHRRPDGLYRDQTEERFWREVSNRPDQTFDSLRGKFRSLEARLRRMEEKVTRSEFDLADQFRDLEQDRPRQSR